MAERLESSSGVRRDRQPVLVCFSQTRWSLDERLQHLMARAAQHWHVYVLEEPVYADALREPELSLTRDASGVVVALPRFPSASRGLDGAVQSRFLDQLIQPHAGAPLIFWYTTALAVSYSLHREPTLCIYDCLEELADPQYFAAESILLSLADLVFAGDESLYEAKKSLHPRVHAIAGPGSAHSWDDTWREMLFLMEHELSWGETWNSLSGRLHGEPETSADVKN